MGLTSISESEMLETEGSGLFGKICKWVGCAMFIAGTIATCGAALIVGGALVADGLIEDGPSIT